MPSIFAQSSDASIQTGNVAYSSARSATTGTVNTVTDTSAETGIVRFSSRGGGNTVRINRLFFRFNTSGISATPSSANFKFTLQADLGATADQANLISVKSDAFTNSGQLQSSDFDNRIEVLPVSDPNAATMAQRIMQHQAAMQLAQT